MSDELPEEYQPSCRRKEFKQRPLVLYARSFRAGGTTLPSFLKRSHLFKVLEWAPSDNDLNKGMPVIVRLNKDGSEEVLYVWHISRNLWVRERGVR